MYCYISYNRNIEKDTNTYKSSLGEQLKYCREQEGFGLNEVAAYLRRSPKTLRKYEQDMRDIPYMDMALLSLLYLRSLEYICLPLNEEFTAQKKAAALLLKYAKYSNKFYNADKYFPPQNEYKAIIIIAEYPLFPIPKTL